MNAYLQKNIVFSRQGIMGLVAAIVFFLLLVGLFRLQVIKHDYYRVLSDVNRIRVLPIPSARGRVLDSAGRVLVDNKPQYTVAIMPYEFTDSTVADSLAHLLQMKSDEILGKLQKTKLMRYSPVKIKKGVSLSIVSQIQERISNFPGVVCITEPVRVYPCSSIASHILGYTGEISAAELREFYRFGIRAGNIIGKQGVERQYDLLLRGKDGAEFLEVRANGEVVGYVKDKPPVLPKPGADLILTIDLSLQVAAESIFAIVPRGAMVVMDPRNGDILAAVSNPGFDSRIFTEIISDELWRELNDPALHPLLCRWYQGVYPPASTLKLLTAAAAVDEGIANLQTRLEPCLGGMLYGDRWFFCWHRSGHGLVDMREAIAQSCDVYFYQIAARMGVDKWVEYAKKCRIGTRTGIDLPYEAGGFLPDRDYYNKRYGRRGWGAGVVLNLAIGQGEILVTPLQMALLFSAFANGGKLWKPRIVKQIRPADGFTKEFQPQEVGRLPFSEFAIKTAVEGAVAACNEPWGTGYGSFMSDLKVAGKTGTAQNYSGTDHAWFVSFAPVDNPEIVVVILVEEGGSGGSWAFIARQFYDYYFNIWKENLAFTH